MADPTISTQFLAVNVKELKLRALFASMVQTDAHLLLRVRDTIAHVIDPSSSWDKACQMMIKPLWNLIKIYNRL